MNSSPHSLILASAGTGKTYRLSGRMLSLLLDGVAPERILATTFTRKAAGEILDRVLERLMKAAATEEGRAELAQALDRPQLSQAACLELLCQTTRQLNAFRVCTIDSFFVHLTKLFALDLEMPPGWSIADERVDERVRSDALQEILGEQSQESVAHLIYELNKGKAGRGVHRSLLGHIAKMRDFYLESDTPAWDSFGVGGDVSDEVFEKAIADVEAAGLPLTAAGSAYKSWEKARARFVTWARAEAFNKLVSDGIGAKLLAGSKFDKKDFPEDLAAAMTPVLVRASHRILNDLKAHNLAVRDLLDIFEQSYQKLKRELGAYDFSDLPHAFAPRTAKALPIDDRELDLWFRLDGRIDHLLLDEFQDTSPVQWRILAPMAEEITADGTGERTFFCVGDVKQSIYAFRQAEPRLLRDLPKMLPGLGSEATEHMNRSYRSSRVVLDTVNRVFTGLVSSGLFTEDGFPAHLAACETFEQEYGMHEAARDLPGAAYIVQALPGENQKETERALIERVVERAAQILEQAPGASIGILTRSRKPIANIINKLGLRGIEASGEGGNVLTDARSVLAFLSVMQLADFPDDSAAAFHLAESPFAEHLGITDIPQDSARRSLSRELRLSLANLGLSQFVYDYAVQVVGDGRWSAWDKERFAQLLDLANAFEGTGETRPSAFVDHVRKKSVELPGGSRVRVMTIHGSKGLEFDAVLLPELGAGFAGRKLDILTQRPEPDGRIEQVSIAPKKGLLPLSADLQELYRKQVTRAMGDDLSVLYVAMTRAARRIDMIVPFPKERKKGAKTPPSPAELLRCVLAKGENEPADDGVVWSHADNSDWSAGLSKPPSEELPSTPAKLSLAPPTGMRNLPRRTASSEEGKGKRNVHEALRPSRGSEIGTLVHALLEDLVWCEDYDAASAAGHPALQCATSGIGDIALKLVHDALEAPAIVEALSKQACGAPAGTEITVQGEAAFSLVLDGELWNGSIDRLVLAREGDQVVWAEITDYKTDNPGTDGLDTLVEHYRPQLERYAQVIQELHGIPRASITTRLLFLGAGAVRELD